MPIGFRRRNIVDAIASFKSWHVDVRVSLLHRTRRQLWHLIRRLHQQSTQVFQRQTQSAGLDLTSVQFAALDAIAQQPGIDQATLSATIGFDRATIGGVIDRLEQKGYVQRSVSAQERRARRLCLTPEGRRLLSASRPVVEALQAEILAPLSAAERTVFLALAHRALGLG